MIFDKALEMLDIIASSSRAFIMIVGLGYVVNNDGSIMRVTGAIPVYARMCIT